MRPPQVQITRLSCGLFVAVYGEQAPTDPEWGRYMAIMREIEADDRLLIFSWGGGPKLRQRRELEEAVTHHQGKVAVVTSNRVARAIVSAIGWTGKRIKAFDFGGREQAIAYLELGEEQRAEALAQAQRMAALLGLPDLGRLAPALDTPAGARFE